MSYGSDTARRLRALGRKDVAIELEWLYRELNWCRKRLRRDGYQETLDRHMAEGPSTPDTTPGMLS